MSFSVKVSWAPRSRVLLLTPSRTCLDATAPPTTLHVSPPLFTTPEIHIPPAEVEQTWKDLPIIMMEQEIMETINYHPTDRLCSFMKRVLAQNNSVLEVWLSVLHSHVVWLSSPLPRGWLMSLVFVSVKKLVSKLSTVKNLARIHLSSFMTDGILYFFLLQNDLSLRLYSVIILDEAHERILKTDIHSNWDAHSSHQNQRGTLQGSVFYQKKKKTLQGSRFPNRQYSVTIHFSKRSCKKRLYSRILPFKVIQKRTGEVNYIGEAYKKLMSIHKKIP
ncbi:hypothetical protein HID58_093688 [Brassica napus]|uniref:Uncharacterized protein n=1 Tax=Brassica napus TaxID=3708 RepID=A0ABQ7X9Y8_BRANA|nr:hypothetical protein HID58_093688 [Brassica napus]